MTRYAIIDTIKLTMYPILFSIGSINFYSYGLFISIAFIATYFMVEYLAKRKKLPTSDLFEKMVAILLSGIIIGHVSYFICYRDQFLNWYEIFYLWAGLTSFGGILGGVAAMIWVFRKNFYAWADTIAVAFLFGVFFWRIGCTLAGDHPCLYSGAWYAINHQIPVPLMESLLGLIGGVVFLGLYLKKIFKDGFLFWLAIAYYGLVRLIIDQWRIDPTIFGLNYGQAVGIVCIIIAIVGIILGKKIRRNNVR